MLLVSGIDALGRIADEEVLLPLLPRHALELGNAYLLSSSGVHRGLEHDGRERLKVRRHKPAGREERPEVGEVRLVDRRRHGDHDHVRRLQG
jgi:hypothetical protein